MGDKKALNPRRSRIITEMRNDPDITIAQLRVVLNCAETTVENNIAYLRKTDTSNELVRERRLLESFVKFL